MVKQGLFNDSILEKKFKILRTSIMLGNVSSRDEMIKEYADTALEIDKIKSGIYEEKLASKMYTTTSLDEEEERLNELIDLIQKRVDERNSFIDDYIKITGNYLDDLDKVSGEDDLTNYKIRLDNIHEFLSNCHEMLQLNDKLESLRDELQEKYESKANNEIINAKLEEELIDEFNRYITRNNYYASLNYMDIDDELAKIEVSLNDKKDVMNTFISSYEALRNAGISGAEREEYLSYVRDSKHDYYEELEKKYILDIYKLVLDKESEYDKLYEKRTNIDNLLKERLASRNSLDVSSRDELTYFTDLCHEQFSVIKSQRFVIDNIDKLIVAISNCESRLEALEAANNREEIVSLVDEFSEEKPKANKIDMPSEEEIKEEVYEEENKTLPEREPNQVVKVSEPVKINVKKASDTAKLVMKKVVIVLEPKRFNNKRDKIKEAEVEIAIEDSLKEKEEPKKIEPQSDRDFVELDVNNETDDASDNVFIDTPSEEKSNTSYLEDVRTNILNSENIIPTEIFIDNRDNRDVNEADLFSQTDPFLDDNEFEINSITPSNDVANGMPMVDNIGTVKPTSALSKIEDASKENGDINLPTNGLANSGTTDVPIVSENYIKEQNA